MNKTPAEIDTLKESWLKDPMWDIENTEGFEEHYDELVAFHKGQAAKRDAENAIREAQQKNKTFEMRIKELQSNVEATDYRLGHLEDTGSIDVGALELANLNKLHVEAILMLTEQVKRIGDILEDTNSNGLAQSVEIWGTGK